MSIMTAMPQGAAVEGINPNLLDNWYFVGGGSQQGGGQFPINQRGATSGQTTNNSYGLDRWKWSYGSSIGTWSLVNAGLTLTPVDSVQMIQLCRSLTEFPQRRLTASVLFSDGTFCSGSETLDANGTTQYWSGNNVVLRSVNYDFRVIVYETKTIIAVKLELGDQQTLAKNLGTAASPNWVLNETPDYATELLKCTGAMGDSSDTYSYRQYPFGVMNELALYVDATNGNDTNDGFTSSTPLATIDAALAKIPRNCNYPAHIFLAAGTYTSFTCSYKSNYLIDITHMSGVDRSTILIAGASCTGSLNSNYRISHVTFTGGVNCEGYQGGTTFYFNTVNFQSGITISGPMVIFSGCSFTGSPTTAISLSFGMLYAYALTIGNGITNGVYASHSSIATISTSSLSNQATNPYVTNSSGRIFVGPRMYQEDHSRVTLFNGTQAIAQSAYTDVTLFEPYNHFQTLELLFDQGNANTRMSIHLTPTSFINDGFYVIGNGSTIGTVRIANYAGSYSIIRFRSTTLSSLRLINVYGQY